MKSVYEMDEQELRDHLLDALLRWQNAERLCESYQRENKELSDRVVKCFTDYAVKQAQGCTAANDDTEANNG